MIASKGVKCLIFSTIICSIIFSLFHYAVRAEAVALELIVNTLRTQLKNEGWRFTFIKEQKTQTPWSAEMTFRSARLSNQHDVALNADQIKLSYSLFFSRRIFFTCSDALIKSNSERVILQSSYLKGFYKPKDYRVSLQGPDLALGHLTKHGVRRAALSSFKLNLHAPPEGRFDQVAWSIIFTAKNGRINFKQDEFKVLTLLPSLNDIKVIVVATHGRSPSFFKSEGYESFLIQEASARSEMLYCNAEGHLNNHFAGTLWTQCSGLRSFLSTWLEREFADISAHQQLDKLSEVMRKRSSLVPDQITFPLHLKSGMPIF